MKNVKFVCEKCVKRLVATAMSAVMMFGAVGVSAAFDSTTDTLVSRSYEGGGVPGAVNGLLPISAGQWSWGSDTDDQFAGKASGDKYRKATASASAYFQVNYDADRIVADDKIYNLMSKDTAKYVVFSFDIAPDANTASNFSLGWSGSNAFFKDRLSVDKWNQVTLVIKNGATADNAAALEKVYDTSSDAAAASPHKYDLYINGNIVARNQKTADFGMKYKNSDGTTRSVNYIRLTAGASGNKTCRFDNLILFETDTYSESRFADDFSYVTSSDETKAVVVNDKIIVYGDSVTADVLTFADGTTNTLFNSGMTQKTDTTLANGDVFVVHSGSYANNDYKIRNYTVVTKGNKENDQTTLIDLTSYSQISDITSKMQIAGTGVIDDALKISGNNGNPYLYTTVDTTKNDYRYYAYEVEIKYGDAKNFNITTNAGGVVSRAVAPNDSRVKPNDWNKFLIILDAKTAETKTYVNGALVSLRTNAAYKLRDAANNAMRVSFSGCGTSGAAYIKSFKLTAANAAPSAFNYGALIDGMYADGKWTLTPNPILGSSSASAVLIIDDGNSYSYTVINSDTTSIEVAADRNVYLWDGFENLKPLCGMMRFIYE